MRELFKGVSSAYGLAPLVPSLAGAVVLAATGLSVLTTTVAAMLVVAGLISGRWVSRRHTAEMAAIRREGEIELERAAEHRRACVAVCVRQLNTVRGQADTEVAQLARSFGEIASRLDNAVGPSRFNGHCGDSAQQEIVASMERNARELDKLVTALRSLQTSKRRVVDEIGAEAGRLRDNASDIRQIALHSRMVSLNATIEAARAGQAGKPFGVIINDMRELATRTAAASELFSQHTQRLHAMVSAAFQEQAQTDASDISIAGAQAMVKQVVADSEATMRQLTREIKTMEDERIAVREDVSRVLVSLQFQDRVSQILSHVAANLEQMPTHIEDGWRESLDARASLDRMAPTYSTHQEFRNHGDDVAHAAHDPAEVTFF